MRSQDPHPTLWIFWCPRPCLNRQRGTMLDSAWALWLMGVTGANNPPPPTALSGVSHHFHGMGWGWVKGPNNDWVWKWLFYILFQGKSYRWLNSFSLLRLVLSYKGSLELLVRNQESKRERLPAKSKARWSRRGLPAYVLGCLAQMWSCQLLLLLAGGEGSWELRGYLSRIKMQSYVAQRNPISHPVTQHGQHWTQLWQPQRVFPHLPSCELTNKTKQKQWLFFSLTE